MQATPNEKIWNEVPLLFAVSRIDGTPTDSCQEPSAFADKLSSTLGAGETVKRRQKAFKNGPELLGRVQRSQRAAQKRRRAAVN